MRRFRFRLETVLDMRGREEEEIKRELAGKQREILMRQETMETVHRLLVGLQSEESTRLCAGVDIQALRATVFYRHKLKRDLVTAGNELIRSRGELEEIRERLTRAVQARRALELLRERRFAEWRHAARREEQAFSDDVSQRTCIRQRERIR